MKAEDLHALSDTQLLEDLEKARHSLFILRFEIETRKTKNHQGIPATKKNIARIMTVLRERELMRTYGGLDIEPVREDTPAKQEAPRRRGLIGRNR